MPVEGREYVGRQAGAVELFAGDVDGNAAGDREPDLLRREAESDDGLLLGRRRETFTAAG